MKITAILVCSILAYTAHSATGVDKPTSNNDINNLIKRLETIAKKYNCVTKCYSNAIFDLDCSADSTLKSSLCASLPDVKTGSQGCIKGCDLPKNHQDYLFKAAVSSLCPDPSSMQSRAEAPKACDDKTCEADCKTDGCEDNNTCDVCKFFCAIACPGPIPDNGTEAGGSDKSSDDDTGDKSSDDGTSDNSSENSTGDQAPDSSTSDESADGDQDDSAPDEGN